MEAAGEVSGDMCIGLEVNRQGRQRGLRLHAAAAEQVCSHADEGRNPRAGERGLKRSIWDRRGGSPGEMSVVFVFFFGLEWNERGGRESEGSKGHNQSSNQSITLEISEASVVEEGKKRR